MTLHCTSDEIMEFIPDEPNYFDACWGVEHDRPESS